MTRALRFGILAVSMAVLAVGCMTSTSVNSTNVAPTPLPTPEPVFIPTTAPPPLTADLGASEESEDNSESTKEEAPTTGSTPYFRVTPDATVTPDTTVTPASTVAPTSDEIADATMTPAPSSTVHAFPVPTRAPRPTPVPAPPLRPAPLPTAQAASFCPNGQVLIGSSCGCPAGMANRPGDARCVRLCIQADITMTNSCVCTGELYDNGGQCVKRCYGNEVIDGFGGCKQPTANSGDG